MRYALLTSMQENDHFQFSIYECEIPLFSKDLINSIVTLSNCIRCGESPSSDLSPCSCELEFDHPLLSHFHLEKNCGAKTFGPFNTCDDFIGNYKATFENWRKIEVYLKKDNLKQRSRRSSRNRREREKYTEGIHKDSDIKKIYQLQFGMCCFCGAKLKPFGKKGAFHKEHLKPISRGGTNWPHNIGLACEKCNKMKYSKELRVFWNTMKKIKGEEFVENRKLILKSLHGEKIKLTTKRKKNSKDID